MKQIVFEDVHFDFDRYSLRPEATRALDEAVSGAAGRTPTCGSRSKGTPATSARPNTTSRSASAAPTSVRDYLTSRGIAADRLRTVSYGEERPKYDNAREETRRLNRRAALVVNLQQMP